MSGIDDTLAERGSRYGSFAVQAAIEQDLMDRLIAAPRWNVLAPDQKSAIQMICVKLARITNGDPDYADNWHDIIGYAKLVDDRLAIAAAAREGGDAKQAPGNAPQSGAESASPDPRRIA